MTTSPTPCRRPRGPARGFTLVEVLISAALGSFVLAAVLAANLHLARSGLRAARYAELEPQVRRGLEALGTDLRSASGLVLNGPSDLTLTVPNSNGSTTQFTYAWTSGTAALIRVQGADSTATTGRIILISGVPPAADGTAGVVFERLDRDGAATNTDPSTKQIRVRLTAARGVGSGAPATRYASAAFMLRNKAVP